MHSEQSIGMRAPAAPQTQQAKAKKSYYSAKEFWNKSKISHICTYGKAEMHAFGVRLDKYGKVWNGSLENYNACLIWRKRNASIRHDFSQLLFFHFTASSEEVMRWLLYVCICCYRQHFRAPQFPRLFLINFPSNMPSATHVLQLFAIFDCVFPFIRLHHDTPFSYTTFLYNPTRHEIIQVARNESAD